MKYAFTTEEINKVERLSKEIESLKRSCNIQTKKVYPNASDFEIGVRGLMAEYAVAKICGQDLNMDVYQNHGDFGQDFTIGQKTVDVKFNSHPHGYLYFISPGHFKADIAVLCVPGMDEFEVEMVGAISRKKFSEKCFTKDFGYGVRYCVRQADLLKFEDFLTWVKKIPVDSGYTVCYDQRVT